MYECKSWGGIFEFDQVNEFYSKKVEQIVEKHNPMGFWEWNGIESRLVSALWLILGRLAAVAENGQE